jgi:hypothetical protein
VKCYGNRNQRRTCLLKRFSNRMRQRAGVPYEHASMLSVTHPSAVPAAERQ